MEQFREERMAPVMWAMHLGAFALVEEMVWVASAVRRCDAKVTNDVEAHARPVNCRFTFHGAILFR